MQNTTIGSGNMEQDDEQNSVWEANHQKILDAIKKATEYAGTSLPTVTEISRLTGLSRKTIYQHFNNFSSHPAYKQRTEMYEALQSEVVLKICRQAMRGDMHAAKLYLELTGKIQPKNMSINSTSNNIQINGMILNQQILQALSAEQLKKIEEIIRPAITAAENGLTNS